MPLPADVQICSVDDHVIEHRDVFKDRFPTRFADRAPKIVDITGSTTDPLGNVHEGTQQVWEIDGQRYPTIGLNAVAGKPKEEFGLEPGRFDEMLPGLLRRRRSRQGHGPRRRATRSCASRSSPGSPARTFFAADRQGARPRVRPGVERLRSIDEWCGAHARSPDPAGDWCPTGTSTPRSPRSSAIGGEGREGDLLHRESARGRAAFVPRRPLGPVPRRARRRPTCRCASTSAAAERPPWHPRRQLRRGHRARSA